MHVTFTVASAVKRKKKKIVVTGIFAAKMSVKSYLIVKNMFVKEDVMQELVGSVRCKENGHVLVGKEFMKGCPVMEQLRFAVQHVISC